MNNTWQRVLSPKQKMAASLLLSRATSKALKCFLKTCAPKFTNCDKRYLLSQAYSCTEAWKKRMEDPVFSQIPLSEFAIELRDQYEKQKVISAVDMEILANKLHEMDIDEAEFMEDLMKKWVRVICIFGIILCITVPHSLSVCLSLSTGLSLFHSSWLRFSRSLSLCLSE